MKLTDHALLTADEECNLMQEYRAGSCTAWDKLITSNIRLVYHLVRKYPQAAREDLISEGCIGLMEGVKRFDSTKNIRLSTYVSWWINAYILNYLLRNARLVKVGTTAVQQKLFYNLRKERARLESQGLEVTPEMIAERLGVQTKDVEEMEIRLNCEKQLDQPLYENGTTALDFIASDGMTPDEALADAQRRSVLSDFQQGLLPNEKVVFEHRLMQDETLQQVGTQLDLTRERVRQVESGIKVKLRLYCERRNLQLV